MGDSHAAIFPSSWSRNPIERGFIISIFRSSLLQAAIAELEPDWQALLQADLGLTELGFCTLLSHRHEFQEGAFLEEGEKKPVHVLKSKFNPESLE